MDCERSIDMDLGIGGVFSADKGELLKDDNLSLESDFRNELNEGLRANAGSPAGDFCKSVLSGRRAFLLTILPFLEGGPVDSGASSLSTFSCVCSDFGGLE